MEMLKLTGEEFKKITKIVYDLTGIYLPEEKNTLLSNRLRKRLRELKLSTFADYHTLLLDKKALEEELPHFLSAVTTNETYFFRNKKLWSFIRETWIPEIVARKKSKHLRIWSAASSSGEEAYTMAICLKEHTPSLANWNVRVVASDISNRVLDQARRGIYNDYSLSSTPKAMQTKWFNKTDEGYEVKDSLRKIVNFQFHNLRDSFAKGTYDFVFLRNVLMYFDTPMKIAVMKTVTEALNQGGHLYVGDVDPIRQTPELHEAMTLERCGLNLYTKPAVASVGVGG